MDSREQKALEAAGWRVGTVQEFLGLTDEENQIVELRVAIALRIRRLRRELKLTQGQFAKLIHSSQSRVAKIEAGADDVSLDLMFRSFFAAGGHLADLIVPAAKSPPKPSRQSRPTIAKNKSKKLAGGLM